MADENGYPLTYTVGDETQYVNVEIGDSEIHYEFIDGDGSVENESYSRNGPRPTSGGNLTRYEQLGGMSMRGNMGMGPWTHE